MEVNPGYKQTEVGVIPERWEVKPLQTVAHIERGKFTARPRNDPKYYGGEIPFIQTGDVTNSGCWITTYSQTLNLEGLKVSKLFPQGTLFFTIAANIGDVAITRFATACPDSLVSITPARGIDKQWLAYELANRKPLFENLASHNAQLNINLEKLRPYLLPVPPLAEQEAIAEALSDADGLIESLEQLITKKRQIKKGAMQELLTGKKRLPGFSGEWEERTLFDLAGCSKELFDDGDWIESEHITNEGIRLVQTGNIGVGYFIERSDKKYIFEESFVSLRCKEIRQGDLLICRLADPAGRACVLPEIDETKIITSVDVTIFRPPEALANRVFLANTFSTDQWFRAVSNQSGGTTHKRISRGALGRLRIRVPSVEEQTAIATILSAMDKEIAALAANLSKARQLKQGMMQELLTGRIRLI